ncbi:hypothetical protein [Pseudomonas phage PH826]|nr:hypothetical protein [Pseudomonas phage PH826]
MIELSFSSVVNTLIEQQLNNVRTAIPGRVIRVYKDLETLMIDAQPLVNRLYDDGTSEEQPTILSVPVQMPGTRRTLVSFPLFPGDEVLLVFCERGIDNFKAGTGNPTKPTGSRTFSGRDAVAIPGVFPFAVSPNNPAHRKFPHSTYDLVVAHNLATATECEVRLKENGNIELLTDLDVNVKARNITLEGSEGITLNTPDLKVQAQNTTWTGNITHSGNYTQTGVSTFNGIPFHTHVHGGVMPGGGTTAVPQA